MRTVRPGAQEIPPIVHVIWMGEFVPCRVERLVAECKDLNPDLDVRLWRDDDLAGLDNRELFDAERSMAGKADIARYEILRDVGGVYLDADFVLYRSLAPIFSTGSETGFVAARECPGAFNNAFIASAPGHPLITEIVRGLPRSASDFRDFGPVVKYGPAYFTRAILDYVAQGGAVTELPQAWVYPYFYDRPDLAERARSSQTLLRHDWASATGSWVSSLTPSRQDEAGRSLGGRIQNLRSRLNLQGLRARLSAIPEVQQARDRGPGLAASALSLGASIPPSMPRLSDVVGVPASLGDDSPLSGPLRASLMLAIRRRVHGSGTFLDLGLSSGEFWRAAARRIDRPGRALRVGAIDDLASNPEKYLRDSSVRGSLGYFVSGDQDLRSGEIAYSCGTPFAPRTLDSSRSLDGWDCHAVDWHIGSLLEACPFLDLMVVSGNVSPEAVEQSLMAMIHEERVGELVVVLNPSSTRQRIDLWEPLLAQMDELASRTECLGALGNAGPRSWRYQLRAAHRAVGFGFRFDPP